MKKGLLIAGLCLLALGFGLSWVGRAMGGATRGGGPDIRALDPGPVRRHVCIHRRLFRPGGDCVRRGRGRGGGICAGRDRGCAEGAGSLYGG